MLQDFQGPISTHAYNLKRVINSTSQGELAVGLVAIASCFQRAHPDSNPEGRFTCRILK
jgi:hypothetical protein